MDDSSFEYSVLAAVQASQGPVTQRTFSQRVGRSVSSVNFALRLFAAKGFIKISGANAKSLRYCLTPQGVLQKSLLAYNFLCRQTALYEEARRDVLGKLEELKDSGAKSVALFGWTPFTETAVLYLVLNGIRVVSIYVEELKGIGQWNKIPFRLITDFEPNCEVIVLMEPLPERFEQEITAKKVVCFPTV